MSDYKPLEFEKLSSGNDATDSAMLEKTLAIVDSIPEQTVVDDNQAHSVVEDVPLYMAPTMIEVKRYVLRK